MKIVKILSVVLVVGLSLTAFQNCGSDFNPAEYSNQSSLSVPSVEVAPVINSKTPDLTVTAGQPIVMSVSTSGTNLVYTWFKNNVAIAGANGPSYTIAASVAGDAAQYKVVVSNSVSQAFAQIVVAITPVVPPVVTPVITQQPAPLSFDIVVGGSFPDITVSWVPAASVLSVSAVGVGLTYQWYFDPIDLSGQPVIGESAIAGATASTYTINAYNGAAIRPYNEICGSYRVLVTNTVGSVSSIASIVTCTVNGQPF